MYFDVMSEWLCDVVVVVEGRPESDDDKKSGRWTYDFASFLP